MWPFRAPKIAQDDLARLDRLEEKVESAHRRIESLIEDVDEYFRKINKARQRVVKEEKDATMKGELSFAEGNNMTRDQLKAKVRAEMRQGGAR